MNRALPLEHSEEIAAGEFLGVVPPNFAKALTRAYLAYLRQFYAPLKHPLGCPRPFPFFLAPEIRTSAISYAFRSTRGSTMFSKRVQ